MGVLGGSADRELREAHEQIVQAQADRTDDFDWMTAAEACLVITGGRARQAFPLQRSRLKLFQDTGRASYEAEEPGSPWRQRIFGD